jgi:hypothetical protein
MPQPQRMQGDIKNVGGSSDGAPGGVQGRFILPKPAKGFGINGN